MTLRIRSMLRLAFRALPFQMRQRSSSTSSTITAFDCTQTDGDRCCRYAGTAGWSENVGTSCWPISMVWQRNVSGLLPASTGSTCCSTPATSSRGISRRSIGNPAAASHGGRLASNDRWLNARQKPLRLEQGRAQLRDIAETIRPADLCQVGAPAMGIIPGRNQPQDPSHPRSHSRQVTRPIVTPVASSPTRWTLPSNAEGGVNNLFSLQDIFPCINVYCRPRVRLSPFARAGDAVLHLSRFDLPYPLGGGHIRISGEIPVLLNGRSSCTSLEISYLDKMLAAALHLFPAYGSRDVRVTSEVLHLVEFRMFQQAPQEEVQKPSGNGHVMDTLRARVEMLENQLIWWNKHSLSGSYIERPIRWLL